MCETFNSVILKAREKPIVTMLEEIKEYLMDRWAKNKKDAEKLQPLAVLPKIKQKLDKEFDESSKWTPRWAGDKKFEVKCGTEKFVVDLDARSCGCRKWMLTGIPCAHAISCMNYRGDNREDYIPVYYKTEKYKACYAPVVQPSQGQNLWRETNYEDVLPPPYRKPIGRPKKRRTKEANEQSKNNYRVSNTGSSQTCRTGGVDGHNRRTCKGPPPEASSSTPMEAPPPVETTRRSKLPQRRRQKQPTPVQPSPAPSSAQGTPVAEQSAAQQHTSQPIEPSVHPSEPTVKSGYRRKKTAGRATQ